jgi:hypothetical protein
VKERSSSSNPAVLPPVERGLALVTAFGLATLIVLAVLDRRDVVDLRLIPAIVLAAVDVLLVAAVFVLRRRRLRSRRPARDLSLQDPTMTRRRTRRARPKE